jgi:tRNA A37 threonylcarbamoyladenosine modification protein TsaB
VAASALEILPATEWLARREPAAWVTGPGLSIVQDRLPAETGIVEATAREPQARSLLEVGLKRYRAELFDDVWALEPLYARLTSAEEKWAQQKK